MAGREDNNGCRKGRTTGRPLLTAMFSDGNGRNDGQVTTTREDMQRRKVLFSRMNALGLLE